MRLRLALILLVLSFSMAVLASADVVYSDMPTPLPPNVPSQGYECCQVYQFGQGVNIGAASTLTGADILMSDWALESTYESVGTSTGFDVPITLNLYDVGAGDSVGSLIASFTETQHIDWRPEASAACGTGWLAGDGNCYNGLAQIISFDLDTAVPTDFIWGIVFNTQNYGPDPTGVPGPYDSLNVGTSPGSPSAGADLVSGGAYLNSTWAGAYGDGGAGGLGTFRLDPTGWEGYDPAATFYSAPSVPEPASVALFGTALLFGGLLARRFRRKRQ